MTGLKYVLAKLAPIACWLFALACCGIFMLAAASVFLDPLWRPTPFVPLVHGLVAAASLGLAVGAQWRDRRRVRLALAAGVIATLLISSVCYAKSSATCRELKELERSCEATGDCAELSDYRAALYDAVCRFRPFACQHTHHAGPQFSREDVTSQLACGGNDCPRGGRRCDGSTLETCNYPNGWVATECPNGCIVDGRNGARCDFNF